MSSLATLRALYRHTPLMLALAAGAATALALAFIPNDLITLTRTLIAWDVAVAVNLIAILVQTRDITPENMARHSEATDEGRYFVLFGSLLAVAASVTAIVLELQARLAPGLLKNLHVAFVMFTVALSWLFVHTTFAKHYAHEYFGPAGKGAIRKGLLFPGDDKHPDFADFFHFAMVIGVANQTADIQIAAKPIRRIVTLLGVVAFVFNTVILALTINLAAGLFE
jgi:uncharacterized membrane protein